MLKPGTYLQNRYEILERIGSGGMSVVYKAQCHTLNRFVAIKVLKEEFASDHSFVEKFKMEAQSAAGLSHPNIVSVYDVVDEDDLHYIVMELIEGITLKNYIEKKGYLGNQEAIGIAIQVGSGIEAAHEQHIIHRDIKPQNMIISRDGKVKVADFGIARAVSTQTVNATAVGSVHYISPEQARGGYCDERSDIYSFGITMYEMVTGRVPFEGDNTVAVALAHLEDMLPSPREDNPQVSKSLEQIILKCTKKRPNERYSSATEVIADLRKALVDPTCDVCEEESEEKENLSDTRSLSREELAEVQETRRETKEKKGQKEQTNARFERIIASIGIVAAVLFVAAAIFIVAKIFTGLSRPGSNRETSSTSAAAEDGQSLPSMEITVSENQVYMPSVLGLPEDMAEARLKENSLVMKITGEEYSDNYAEGQVMAQKITEGSVVDKWSTVDVTVSRGSDKIEINTLNILQMTGTEAESLLEEKGLKVQKKEENSDTVEKGRVIRYSPEVAKVGEEVLLFISSGAKNVPGQMPNLLGKDQAAADALLAGAGLLAGNITYDSSQAVADGLVVGQSVPEGTVLAPQTPVDYVLSGPQPEETSEGEDSDQYYIGSIDVTCSLSNYMGPATQTSSIRFLVRLKQHVSGADVYTTLINPRLVVGVQDVPVVIPRIKGAYGVDSGTVEVVDADNLTVIASYPVTFFPIG